MKRKSGFIVRPVGGKIFAIPVGERSMTFHDMITLNGVGEFLFNKLENETTEEELVSALLETYDVDRATAESDVSKFLDRMEAAGLLDGNR